MISTLLFLLVLGFVVVLSAKNSNNVLKGAVDEEAFVDTTDHRKLDKTAKKPKLKKLRGNSKIKKDEPKQKDKKGKSKGAMLTGLHDLPAGATCENSIECISNQCIFGTCFNLLSNGQSCDSDASCQSSNCVGNSPNAICQ